MGRQGRLWAPSSKESQLRGWNEAVRAVGQGAALDGDLCMDPSAGAGNPTYFLVVPGRGIPNGGCAVGSLPSPTTGSLDSQCFWVDAAGLSLQ